LNKRNKKTHPVSSLNGRSPSKPGRFLTIEAEETINGRRSIRVTKTTT
jgi:hypothetical protein